MNFIRQIFTMERAKLMRLCIIAGSIMVMDQITKQVVLAYMPLYDSIPVIPGFFHLTHLHNPGGAFGFLAGQAEWLRMMVFLGFSSLAVLVIIFLYATTPVGLRWLEAALAMICGGAVGNLIDRVRMGKVVDFLDVFIGSHHWPAFNVADSAVSIGITIFIYHVVFKKIPE